MSDSEYKGFRHGVRTLTCHSQMPLVDIVASRLAQEDPPASYDALTLLELGSIYVNDSRCLNPSRVLSPGDIVRIHSSPRRFGLPTDLRDRIISETSDSLLVEKPAGLPTEPVVDNVKENLVSYLEDLRGQNLFVVHRITPESEGLVLLAKTTDSQRKLQAAFAEGRIKRTYVAYAESGITHGTHKFFPQESPIESTLEVTSCEDLSTKTNLITEGRSAWVIEGEPIAQYHRLVLESKAARPKEVRAYLASTGAPVLGDRMNGSRYTLSDAKTRKAAIAFRVTNLSDD